MAVVWSSYIPFSQLPRSFLKIHYQRHPVSYLHDVHDVHGALVTLIYLTLLDRDILYNDHIATSVDTVPVDYSRAVTDHLNAGLRS